VRTGYAAIADEWVPIKPGTDGALLLALVHELIALGLYDRDFLARYTNAGQLVNQDEASDDFGLMLRNAEGDVVNPLRPHNFYWWDRHTGRPVADHAEGADPALLGRFTMPDGTPAVPAFQLLQERVQALHRRVGQRHHRHPGRDHPPPGARDGHHRARPEDRTADRLDRLLGQASTRASPATRWPSTPCAGWRRTATAFRPSARWPS
jgi:hypothetical protein